jgi:hypothetical protein
VSRAATSTPRKRRLGKLELAIIAFLAFDLLLIASWKLFVRPEPVATAPSASSDVEPAEAEVVKPEPEPEVAEPEPEPEPEPASEIDDEASEPTLERAEPLSVHEAVALGLPPEPDTPGPVRPSAKSLSDKAFREAMVDARAGILDKCVDGRMRRTLKVALKVAPSGKVEYTRVLGGHAETSLGQCVVKQVYKIEFPITHEGGTHTYTLRLR